MSDRILPTSLQTSTTRIRRNSKYCTVTLSCCRIGHVMYYCITYRRSRVERSATGRWRADRAQLTRAAHPTRRLGALNTVHSTGRALHSYCVHKHQTNWTVACSTVASTIINGHPLTNEGSPAHGHRPAPTKHDSHRFRAAKRPSARSFSMRGGTAPSPLKSRLALGFLYMSAIAESAEGWYRVR